MDTSYDLPDSTDWLSTSLPGFEPVEAALRCEVCKEFLTNPVITSCSHTFCSICIRRCIAADGKCPSCKTGCSSDKLTPNIAVREVVMRFQEARPKALDLARADKEVKAGTPSGKKRKLDETDIEPEDEHVRHTRSRQARGKSRREEADNDAPIEVADSEAESDADFVPEGMAKCPICNKTMKAEQVYNHLDVCPGQDAPSSQGRSTRSKNKTVFPTALTRRKKESSPPPARLSQLNYAMLKETALRKKLQEIGIPTWGDKVLLKRRHIEWLNIYNSNCDADGSVRKSKRQLLKELDEWEQTQGGRAETKESKIMKKDFDGDGYMKTHKNEFDNLIARARQKVTKPKPEAVEETPASDISPAGTTQLPPPPPDHQPQLENPTSPTSNPNSQPNSIPNNIPPQPPATPNPVRPYENNEPALTSIRAQVEAANNPTNRRPSLQNDSSLESAHARGSSKETGLLNPLGSLSRKVPMFEVPVEEGEGRTVQ
ncbi:DNA repair protein rad18 [Plenodomus tracheiphilus IPT5]|uniref:Postreplication repair E3 ubiquitin-protein ligase RAD18 n=1 Tax=Plenodomus tracheiphilus IPT5 TaxID=1408161 RepID=A0A6A7BJW6_9PLEO|nr:DNA repair protein rad18 [Plenodomus tracheiphilus IPT5]